MQFDLTEDQRMLQQTAARFFEREYGFDRRRKVLASGGADQEVWLQMAELGLLGALLPEECGGFGGGVESMVICGLLGRHLVIEPLVEIALLGGTIIARSPIESPSVGDLIEGGFRPVAALLEEGMRNPWRTEGTGANCSGLPHAPRVSGHKRYVWGAGLATHFIVSAMAGSEPRLLLVSADAAGLTTIPVRSVDGGTGAELHLADAPAIDLGAADEHLPEALDRWAAGLCAMAVGSMDRLMEATPEYLSNREQYGAKLASFQALQHRMADMFVALETARSMAWHAALSLPCDPQARSAAVAAALVQVGRSSRYVGQQAVQLHGGMGMSEETDIAHHFKRLTTVALRTGGEAAALRRFDDAQEV
jgi:alkylation response protein AidB-like acyl-CoA dehydrogenase